MVVVSGGAQTVARAAAAGDTARERHSRLSGFGHGGGVGVGPPPLTSDSGDGLSDHATAASRLP